LACGGSEFDPVATEIAPADERTVVRNSGLFHYGWYLTAYPDVADSELDPLEHFCHRGWREGRKPNQHFDPAWYLQTYGATVGHEANPLVDYITKGERAGRRPSPSFDPVKYRARHRLGRDESPLRHYLARQPAPASPNPLSRLFHWMRRPSPLALPAQFDPQLYLEANPDVAAAGMDPAEHYLRYGESEGRRFRPPARPIAKRAIRQRGSADGALACPNALCVDR
jgi:hypothetical protein